MTHWIIKSKSDCRHCVGAKDLLESEGIVYEEQRHDTDVKKAAFISSGFKTFPQVFRDGCHIGGLAELKEYFATHADF